MNDLVLIIISFFSSMLSASIGAGGGLLLLSILPGFLPVGAIIPVHGMVQLASNISRFLFALKQVDRRVLLPYVLGAGLGAAIGSRFVVVFPTDYLPVVLGGFILLMAWLPNYQLKFRMPGNLFFLGSFQSFIALFIGSPGPLSLSVLFRKGLSRDQMVATNSALMTTLHLLKILTFGLLGFVFQPYLLLIAGMVLSVTLGSFAGTQLRSKVSENKFKNILKIILTLLAFRMIIRVLLR